MGKHKKLKVKVIKDINESSNSRNYKIDEILEVTEVKKESNYFQIVSKIDIDMIPKDCVEILYGK